LVIPLVVYVTIRTVDKPTTQIEVNMHGMGTHYVNIWLRPDPPSLNGTTIIAQVANLAGMPMRVEKIDFRISRPDVESSQTSAGVPIKSSSNNMAERGRFQAAVQFPGPGEWQIDVTVGMDGQSVIARLPVVVSE
jgi:hypothetical protein